MDDFLLELAIASPWGNLSTSIEFFYVRGRTDVIAIDHDGKIIAFEAKLSDWKSALVQAYRNTCFAHRSYVLLPEEAAKRALSAEEAFTRRGVGICSFSKGIQVLHESPENSPLQPWLSDKARRYIQNDPTASRP